jgi:hypothetical protein
MTQLCDGAMLGSLDSLTLFDWSCARRTLKSANNEPVLAGLDRAMIPDGLH